MVFDVGFLCSNIVVLLDSVFVWIGGFLVSLRSLSRKVKMEFLKQDEDVCELLFNNRRAQDACRLFPDELKT